MNLLCFFTKWIPICVLYSNLISILHPYVQFSKVIGVGVFFTEAIILSLGEINTDWIIDLGDKKGLVPVV